MYTGLTRQVRYIHCQSSSCQDATCPF